MTPQEALHFIYNADSIQTMLNNIDKVDKVVDLQHINNQEILRFDEVFDSFIDHKYVLICSSSILIALALLKMFPRA